MSQTPELAPELAVAMDWGGTWIRASVIDRQGEIRWQSRVANPKSGAQSRLLEVATELLRVAIGRCAGRALAGIGVAVAGPVDAETGILYDPPNLRVLDGVSLKALWEPLLGQRVWVGNDANLAALGEYHHGAGREARAAGRQPRTLAYLTISTGIGGGVVDRGEMFVGAYGLATEIGHMTIDRSGAAPRCQCGGNGCLEALASGTAIARIARARLAGMERPASILAAYEMESISSELVFEAAAEGDELALDILEGVVQSLSIGLTNVLHLFNPDLVVLGGGVTAGLDQLGLLPAIRGVMLQRVMSARHRDFMLVASRLGDAAGMVGAATLVWKELDASTPPSLRQAQGRLCNRGHRLQIDRGHR